MTAPQRRRGRRPASEDTRTVLVDAARTAFAEQGYTGATVRGIAARAGVDPSMINHWFGGKQKLFAEAVLQMPFQPGEFVAHALEGPADQLGDRVLRTFLTVWDSMDGGGGLAAILRSVNTSDDNLAAFRELLFDQVFSPIVTRLGVADGPLRAGLCASQLLGLAMIRYVLRYDPVVAADQDTLLRAAAPTLQRYLTGELD